MPNHPRGDYEVLYTASNYTDAGQHIADLKAKRTPDLPRHPCAGWRPAHLLPARPLAALQRT